MSKRLLCLLLAMAMMFALFACDRKDDDATEPTDATDPSDATGTFDEDWMIGIVTGTVSQNEEEFRQGENMAAEYGAHATHITYPDNFTTEVETLISQVSSLATNPKIKAIVMVQAVPGTAAAVAKIRETRPDILFIAGVAGDDPSVITEQADFVLGGATIPTGEAMIKAAHEAGATTFIHYSFPRHMGYTQTAARVEVMQEMADELGINFVLETAPDPTGDSGVPGAQQFIMDDVPRKIAQYGVDTAFFATNCSMQEPLIRRVLEGGAIYPQQCCPSPYHAYPTALGIDVSGHEGDVKYMLEQIDAKIHEAGNDGRMGTWPVPLNMLLVEAGVRYAEKWIKGEVDTSKKVDTDVLYPIIDAIVSANAEDAKATKFIYEEPQNDGTTKVYENYIQLICDYYVFGDKNADA